MIYKVLRYVAVFVIGFVVAVVAVDAILEDGSRKLEKKALYDEKRFQSQMQYFLMMKRKD